MECCPNCQDFYICKTKWYRGEKGQPNICCIVCFNYGDCLRKEKQKRLKESKKKQKPPK